MEPQSSQLVPPQSSEQMEIHQSTLLVEEWLIIGKNTSNNIFFSHEPANRFHSFDYLNYKEGDSNILLIES